MSDDLGETRVSAEPPQGPARGGAGSLNVTVTGGRRAASPTTASELGPGALVGRYVVLSRLGAGGMGVVFAAYDPELDRKVAIKLLHPKLAADADPSARLEASARLIREAQSLARLSHPNIVAVHDVGEHQGAVWLAMEYVRGETLSEWLGRRHHGWIEILEVLIAAARGLAAAHDAGLVHRDIKPDNLMISDDGRMRVMDLGLARALDHEPAGVHGPESAARTITGAGPLTDQVTEVGVVVGTPAYMSPEQFCGGRVDARADVFSFCVTLWEALMGERPFAGETISALKARVLAGDVRPTPPSPRAGRIPGWLRRVCLRGLVADPARRYASMTELLDALSRGQARARARAWLRGLAALAAVVAVALAGQRYQHAARITACERAGERAVEVWSDEARARVREGLVATGLPIAPVTADKVMPLLDEQAAALRRHRTEVCLRADVDGTLDRELGDRALWCLDERRMELSSLITELSRADAMIVQGAVRAAVKLSPVSSCADDQVLAALPSPPPSAARPAADAIRAELSQGRTLRAAGKYDEGLRHARAALTAARTLEWPPLVAAAQALEGDLLEWAGAYADSEAASLAAFMEAAKFRAWGVAADAALQLTFVIGVAQARPAEGKVWAGLAEIAILFAGDPLGLHEVSRLVNLATIEHTNGRYADAAELYRRALDIHVAALGPDNPGEAVLVNNLGVIHSLTGAFDDAKRAHTRALAIREAALGPDHPEVAVSLNNLAVVQQDIGDHAGAKPLNQRALAIREATLGPDHPNVAQSLNNLANIHLSLREFDEARALYERALLIRERSVGLEHPLGAAALAALGICLLEEERWAEALPHLERAVAIYGRFDGVQEAELGARLALARALVHTGGDRARARAEAQTAADGYRDAGPGMARRLADAEAVLATLADG